jgi:hypothetical protein
MKIWGKRTWLFRIAIVAIALGGAVAIWAVPRLIKRSVSIKSQVSAYLLDESGNVNGLLLANGDQLHFRTETGAAVVQRISVGDEVTVVGHAGKQSNYGREIRVEQITAKGHTIQEIKSPPPRPAGPDGRPGGPDKHHGPKDRREPGPESRTIAEPVAAPEAAAAQPAEVNAATPATQSVTPEIFKASGTISTHLVNGHGDVDGLILSTGEQVRFSPRVGESVIAAEQGGNTAVSIEGQGVRSERGVVIRPTTITVGNQTITLAN